MNECVINRIFSHIVYSNKVTWKHYNSFHLPTGFTKCGVRIFLNLHQSSLYFYKISSYLFSYVFISELFHISQMSDAFWMQEILKVITIPRTVDSEGNAFVRQFISQFLSNLGWFIHHNVFSQARKNLLIYRVVFTLW